MNPSPALPAIRSVYIAGPMQGIANFNFPRFNAVTAAFRANGHTVFNPAEKDIERHAGVDIAAGNANGSLAEAKVNHGFSLRRALADDCRFICEQCNTIVMLPGWEQSKGAMAEHRLAVALQAEGMEIIYLSTEVAEMMEQMMEQAHGA